MLGYSLYLGLAIKLMDFRLMCLVWWAGVGGSTRRGPSRSSRRVTWSRCVLKYSKHNVLQRYV